jgi:hypothetical protein
MMSLTPNQFAKKNAIQEPSESVNRKNHAQSFDHYVKRFSGSVFSNSSGLTVFVKDGERDSTKSSDFGLPKRLKNEIFIKLPGSKEAKQVDRLAFMITEKEGKPFLRDLNGVEIPILKQDPRSAAKIEAKTTFISLPEREVTWAGKLPNGNIFCISRPVSEYPRDGDIMKLHVGQAGKMHDALLTDNHNEVKRSAKFGEYLCYMVSSKIGTFEIPLGTDKIPPTFTPIGSSKAQTVKLFDSKKLNIKWGIADLDEKPFELDLRKYQKSANPKLR